MKLQDCLYRQEPHHDYIYALCQVNDRASSLPNEFKKIHQKFDLVMVLANVPLGRDPELDLVRINNCPGSLEKRDCRLIEDFFVSKIGEENAYDLAVRKYKDNKRIDNEFLVIYVGRCQRKRQIWKMLIQEGIKIQR